jgi:hypothetical protein
MPNRLQHLRRDEKGMTFVFVGVSLMAFLAATTLAIDVGMFMTARSQAQNAADAGALAGAIALALNDYDNRSATGPAVMSAKNAALANTVVGGVPSVKTTDVTFPLGPTGLNNRVKVTVYRTTARENAVPTLIGGFFGVDTADIVARATAEASPANAMTCVKPFMIPDKWTENSDEKGKPTGTWTPDSTFDGFDNHGNPLPNPDKYVNSMATSGYTGYTVTKDVGQPLTLRAGSGDNINPSFYFSWKMPGDTGGDFYRENIANCNQSVISYGSTIVQEPGNMMGPTIQGIQELILKDPAARWDGSCKCVKDSKFATSPRVFPIPLYDPFLYADAKQNGRAAEFKIANFLGFFVDRVEGNGIVGRVTNVVGMVDTTAGPAPDQLFPKAIRLVE